MAVTIVQILVVAYAKNIIQNGNRNFGTIDSNYVQPVKNYVASTYSLSEIDRALAKKFVSEDEYTDILTIRTNSEQQK